MIHPDVTEVGNGVRSPRVRRHLAVMLVLVLVIVVVCALGACRQTRLEWARERVKVGESRDVAVAALSRESWYYQQCPYDPDRGVTDLFFYGSHRYDDAIIVIMTSTCQRGLCVVNALGSFENYAWQGAYRNCYDRGRFTD